MVGSADQRGGKMQKNHVSYGTPRGLALAVVIGLASSGFTDGMVNGNFEWLAPLMVILMGLVFAPFYFRTGIATLRRAGQP